VSGHLFALPTAARHSSECNEHYTPNVIVDPARQTLREIDLDPASCDEANERIKAKHIFTRDDDGFARPWFGRVFLNPPGGLSDDQQRLVKPRCRETGSCGLAPGHAHVGVEASQKKWWFKLAREYAEGRVRAAIFVCFSVELLQNTQVDTPSGVPIPLDFPICFPSRRVSYLKPGGGVGAQPPHASAVVLLGDADYERRFAETFARAGRVTRRRGPL
jgi:hypothetical protein